MPPRTAAPPRPAAPPEVCSPFAARPPSPVAAENGTPDSLSAGLLSWKWQNFSLCCFPIATSPYSTSLSKCDDTTRKFKVHIMDLNHC